MWLTPLNVSLKRILLYWSLSLLNNLIIDMLNTSNKPPETEIEMLCLSGFIVRVRVVPRRTVVGAIDWRFDNLSGLSSSESSKFTLFMSAVS